MESKKFWNQLSSGYDKHALHTYRQAYADTISKSEKYINPNQIAMDIGCGSGITTIELSKSVKEIYAIDTAKKMIDVAAAKMKSANIKNIHFEVSDIFDARWATGSFDVIMAFNILCYIKDIDSFLSRVFELLKLDGIFLSATDCWGEKRNIITYTQSLLCKAGVLPLMENLKIHDVEAMISKHGFHILESCNLYDKLPNLFIAAKK
ncbi:class I SAM-dependent methyltransferase [Clostridium oryzae]|uniref:Magnesium-protoporphyrin O-methyltransferase n=1 Tax=Clostridium oryzae TaxID=1450648 RepID=A0A1V4IXC8_9CLOT|nr:class I SAM-dependent methyltransferase [Clostridium oryzae]OPJ64606.1 magnesium-protoporphyrin O-methyltransferase [Clostridium oryzae]